MNLNFWKIGTIAILCFILVGVGIFLARFIGNNQTNSQIDLSSNTASSSPQNETMIDNKIDEVLRETAIAEANKTCIEDNLTDEKCKEMKTKLVDGTDIERLETIGNANKKCKEFNYTHDQCIKYKETVVKRLREDLNAIQPFSDLHPQLKATIEEVTKKMCVNMSAEECKKGKWALMKMSQERYKELKTYAASECKKRNVPADKCKELEVKLIENFNKDVMSKGDSLLKQL